MGGRVAADAARATARCRGRNTVLLPRRIIAGASRRGGQRFFVLFGADDFLRAAARVPVVPLFAFALLRAAATLFRPLPFGLPAVSRPVATSSCRCSDPIMRPSDSAERSSSDSLRVRSRAGYAGSTFLAIQSPLAGQMPFPPRLSKRRASLFRPCIARQRHPRVQDEMIEGAGETLRSRGSASVRTGGAHGHVWNALHQVENERSNELESFGSFGSFEIVRVVRDRSGRSRSFESFLCRSYRHRTKVASRFPWFSRTTDHEPPTRCQSPAGWLASQASKSAGV
jgi:hypothetical protein